MKKKIKEEAPEVAIVKLFLEAIKSNYVEGFWKLLSDSGQSFLKGTDTFLLCVNYWSRSLVTGTVSVVLPGKLTSLI